MNRTAVCLLAGAALLVAAAPAGAMDEGFAKLSVSPKKVDPGKRYTLRGTGWNTNSACSKTVRFRSSRGGSLGSVTRSSSGKFTVKRRIKSKAKAGYYSITATQSCEGGAAVRTATLKIR